MKQLIIGNFNKTRDTTVKLAEGIPQELYDDYVAAEVYHISKGVAVWMNGHMKDGKGKYEKSTDKAALLELLHSSRARVLDYWQAIAEAPVSEEWFLDFVLYITGHEIHHRGKLVGHLEGKGVDIPFMPRDYPKS